jgi:hypothetical protein
MEMELVLGGADFTPPPSPQTDGGAGPEQAELGADGQPHDVEPREDALHDQGDRSRQDSGKRQAQLGTFGPGHGYVSVISHPTPIAQIDDARGEKSRLHVRNFGSHLGRVAR